MNWTVKYGEKPMSKKPNRQIKFQFFRIRNGNWSKDAGKWLHDGTYCWSVKVDIADHNRGYSFLDSNSHHVTFASLEKAREYAYSVVTEVIDFLDKEEG